MVKQAIKRQAISPRISGIEGSLVKLRDMAAQGPQVFDSDINFAAAQTYLRQALEGVFNIGAHILSRLPGGRATEYKSIAKKLGELGVVERKFADEVLVQMGGYRNRLVHIYNEITPAELYNITQNNLADFETFLTAIKKVLEHPEKFNLTVE